MQVVAYVVVAGAGHRSVYLDEERAMQKARTLGGVMRRLVTIEAAVEACQAAYEQGRMDAKKGDERGH